MAKPSMRQRIKAAQRKNERDVLAFVRRSKNEGCFHLSTFGHSIAWGNAIDRLVAKGKLRFDRRRGHFVEVHHV